VKDYDIIVIGAGAGGLVVATGAARANKRVLLVEKGKFGGDCTNYGCIPSKTLIAEAKRGNREGALKRVAQVVNQIRSHEDASALAKIGVETRNAAASFISPHEIEVGEERFRGKYFVIATGSSPFIPPIEGLKETPYLTNETIFDLYEVPKRLVILGAGPIGCELAQAFARLGTKVSIIESLSGLLSKEEPEVSEVLKKVFEPLGIAIYLACESHEITHNGNLFQICTIQGELECEHLLVSTGRRPNVESLELEKAGVIFSEKGIPIDSYSRTNQHHIFAIGDVLGGPYFTHLAENHGRTVLTTLLLPGGIKKKIDEKQALPRVTFTDPEVASFGMTQQEAEKTVGVKKIAIYHVPFTDLDRAITADRTEGFLKVITKKWSSQILGATIVGPRAGEMLQELTLAKLQSIPLRKLSRLIHPYPVYSSVIRKAADMWLTQNIIPLFRGKLK